MSIKEEAQEAWLNGAQGSSNPYSSWWQVFAYKRWSAEWVRLEDERNDQIASDDIRADWNRTVKD